MKFTKMSLVAAMLITSSAFALENTKVTGDINLLYATDDDKTAPKSGDMFSRGNSVGQASVHLNIATDLSDTVKAGVQTTVLNTLGLENDFVAGVWEGNTATAWWTSEAWLSTKLGATDVKVGRQAIDTPFAFTETWSLASNTFDAVVASNTDLLPDTTVIAAYIGQTNSGGTGYGSIVNVNTTGGDSFVTDLGAVAIGAINKSIEGVEAQLWYYDFKNDTDAIWAQAETKVSGVDLGAQYGTVTRGSLDATTAIAIKAGYAVSDALSVSVAVSDVNDGTSGSIQNAAGAQTKLYTEAWWMYGYAGDAGTTGVAVAAEYAMKDLGDFGVYYNSFTDTNVGGTVGDVTDLTLTASRSYGNLDTAVALLNTKAGTADAVNSVQVYLTYNY